MNRSLRPAVFVVLLALAGGASAYLFFRWASRPEPVKTVDLDGIRPPAPHPAVGADAAKRAQGHYLAGVVFYQKKDYQKAHDEWIQALRFDPDHADAKASLQRLKTLYGVGE
jgi:hypothetical protein